MQSEQHAGYDFVNGSYFAASSENLPTIRGIPGQPVAALVPIDNADLESVSLGTNREFLDLIERSRARAKAEGAIPNDGMRRRFA